MSLYLDLLEKEEKHRLEEQSTLLSALLSNPSKGKLSILRRAGLSMTGLEVIGRGSGSGARIIIELGPTVFSDDNTKFGCFRAGEIVKIIINGQILNCIGTIERRNKSSSGEISVSLTNNLEGEEMELLTEGSTKIALIKVVDEVGMFEKMKSNIETILNDELEGGDLKRFICSFIKTLPNKVTTESNIITTALNTLKISEKYSFSSQSLNQEQELAVQKSVEMIQNPKRNLILIHGPPGTGKTSVLIEILNQIKNKKIFKQNEHQKFRILILGPSNLSVDNIVERLIKENVCGVLRVGHPSRVLESCQRSTLDFWLENCDEGKLLKDVQKEIDDLVKIQLPKCKNREERRSIFGELKLLRQERRKREKTLQSDLIKRAEIVACTLSTACGKKLKGIKFDLAVIDEAGQALLPETLIAPILADKIIFAGDHFQLPPTVMNPLIKNQLEISLFEHLIKRRNDEDCDEIMLKEQYRMNEKIMKWSNSKFYNNQLRAHESVSAWQLDLDKSDDEIIGDVLIFYDTCGFDLWESVEKSSTENKKAVVLVEGKQGIYVLLSTFLEMSKFNEGEARIAIEHYKKLLSHGIKSESIAIISPYSAQVSLIRDQLADFQPKDQPEINSIDAFQGREKDVVILSMVRSNSEGIVGFLGEMRRINVAMTRAKKQLVIIGDSETLSRDSELSGLIDFLNENAKINFP